ncbi:MAG TPA: GNAT family N-acetyltransferase [Polyangiaceae bacterium]|nr:GNAT family N-acetyltransferase [Polyangiaceae bacterium]
MDCSTRRVTPDDAEAIVALLVASITTLCVHDHLNDPETLARWLRNKTVADLQRWLADPEDFMFMAELGSVASGVALLHSSGAIWLCYVLPGLQRRGVGRALIQRLEAEAKARGITELRLTSTGSARSFYESMGFVATGAPRTAFGVLQEYPYEKKLL